MLFKKDKQAASAGSEKSLQEKMIEKEEAAATKERMAEELIQGKISLFKNPLAVATALVAVVLALLHIFYAYNGVIEAWSLRFAHLTLILLMCFLMKPTGRASVKQKPTIGTVWDLVAIAATLVVAVYIFSDIAGFQNRAGMLNKMDVIMGAIFIVLVLEAARRTVGKVMVILCLFFLAHTAFSNYFPGFLNGPPSSLKSIVNWIFASTEGIFSTPVGVMASYIFLFVLFGSLMIHTGAGELFIDFALVATGKMQGGPAKAAVVSSAIMGTVSGSAAGNVVTTGTFTIPLMKKVGFPPAFAGAVEACASSGGQIMPPVMAATAFIIAETMGVPYIKVVVAAIIPAAMYYWSIFKMVDIESYMQDLKPLKQEDLPDLKAEFKEKGHLIIPLAVLIIVIFMGMSAGKSVAIAIALIFIVSSLRKSTRMSITEIICAFEEAAKSAVPITAACAAAGIIIGSLVTSGLNIRLTSIITNLAGGSVPILLIFTMIAAIILGMGMPTAGVYITLSALVIPALVNAGINLYASHFFPFFFGVFSSITPPVCLAAFAAAGIAGTDPMKTGFESFKLGLIALAMPFFFVVNPALLAQASLPICIKEAFFAFVAVNCLGYAIKGWWGKSSPHGSGCC
ncbi:L-dehydroascorbate transporter large permease subunit [uncultured Clostridium sp.]|nr:L-dehydroascorbate transporter large permease subunit [uncultured Clostridium sp.]